MIKHSLLFLLIILFSSTAFGQLNLEHTYDNTSGLFRIVLENSGEKYYTYDYNQLKIYHTNHTLWKTINIPIPTDNTISGVINFSETIVNSDTQLEIWYSYRDDDYKYTSRVIKENGTVLLEVPDASTISLTQLAWGTLEAIPQKFIVYTQTNNIPRVRVYSPSLNLEHTYDNTSGLFRIVLENSGEKYYTYDYGNHQLKIYHTNHTLWKTINLLIPADNFISGSPSLSETIVNSDAQLEVWYSYRDDDYKYTSRVIKENGAVLLEVPDASTISLSQLAWGALEAIPQKFIVYTRTNNIPTVRVYSSSLNLEHIYDNTSGLFRIVLENSGEKYYTYDYGNHQLKIYHTNHTLWKTINLLIPADNFISGSPSLSETIVNSDAQLETWYSYRDDDYNYTSQVIQEDGTVLLEIPDASTISLSQLAWGALEVIPQKFIVYTRTNNIPAVSVYNVGPVNAIPTVSNPISDVTLIEGFGVHSINVANIFTDNDGDPLTLNVNSSNTNVATASLSGNALYIQEVGIGTATIMLTASDGNGGTGTESFSFTIQEAPNNPPTIINPISNQTLAEGFGTHTIEYGNVFNDVDNDALSYAYGITNNGVVTVSFEPGNILVLNEVGLGSTTIILRALDGRGGAVDDEFTITVQEFVNTAPVVVTPIADLELEKGFTQRTINLAALFTDVDGHSLTFSANSSNQQVATVSISSSVLKIIENELGTTTIIVTASDGHGGEISDSFELTISEVLGIERNDFPNLKVFPNPTKGRLNFQFGELISGRISVESLDGKTVLQQIVKNQDTIFLDLTLAKSGLFIVRIEADNSKIARIKVLKL